MNEVLGARPLKLILPFVPPHTFGLTDVTLPAVGVGGPAAVSYTHLDVYKRQPPASAVMVWVAGTLLYLYFKV